MDNIRSVTLAEILDTRERRYELQKRLLSKYRATLISFTMNVAGPIKNTPLIERAFSYGLSELLARLPNDKLIFQYSVSAPQGCEGFIAVDLSAKEVKDICVGIEEASRLGRLFDIDVIDQNGAKLERKHPRACIVCGKPGRECAAGRLHPVEKIAAVTNDIITEHFVHFDARRIGTLAMEALIQEVETTPKPGLVDLRNSGSHTDMDVYTFRKSALALAPYFAECVEIGIKGKALSLSETFKQLRISGIAAENTMYAVTNGINTHKGAIYSMGVLLGAIGRSWTPDIPIKDIETIVTDAAALVRESSTSDFVSAKGATHGERLFLEHGLKGIRGEVASGFPSVMNYSLPTYKSMLKRGLSQNDAGVCALLNLISVVDDTNVYHRGGTDGARFAKSYATHLLEKEFNSKAIEEMDDEFIKRNLSPGGAADLLAITYFLHMLQIRE